MTDAPTERHYVDYMTGFVDPMTPPPLVEASGILKTMKECNANTLTIYPSTYVSGILSPVYEYENPFLIGIIKEVKNQGLAVRVSGQSGPSQPDITDEHLYGVISSRVLEWAEISEELGVEYFSPWTEVDYIGRERAIRWHAEILPQIRERFSGKVFSGWVGWSDDDSADDSINNFTEALIYRVKASSDFDGVVFDIPTPEKWQYKYFFNISKEREESDPYRPSSLEEMVIATSQIAKEIGIPIYIGEFSVSPVRAPFGLEGNKMFLESDTERADYYRKYLDIVMPRYDGVLHLGFLGDNGDNWLMLVFGVDNAPVKEVLKEKFGEYTTKH